MSSTSNDNNLYENIEVKRQKNLEENRRFLAALKIIDIRDQIKETTEDNDRKRMARKEIQTDMIRRSSRIRKYIRENENNLILMKEKQKKLKSNSKENQINSHSKLKIQLPEHMLLRYQSTGKKIALHNSKAKFIGDDENLS